MTSSVAPHHGIVCPLVIRRPASSQWMGKHHFAEMELNTSFVAKIASDDLTFNFQNHVMCVGGNALPEKILHVFVFPSILSSYFHSIQHTGVCSVIEYSLAVWRLGGDEENNTSTMLNTEQCLGTAAAPYLYEMSDLFHNWFIPILVHTPHSDE